MTFFAGTTSDFLLEPALDFDAVREDGGGLRRRCRPCFIFCWNYLRFLLEPLFYFATNREDVAVAVMIFATNFGFLLEPYLIFAAVGEDDTRAATNGGAMFYFLLEPLKIFAGTPFTGGAS